jgi:hypothetical protein
MVRSQSPLKKAGPRLTSNKTGFTHGDTENAEEENEE